MVQFSENFWNETNVLVTGGASFIGSHLVDSLVSLGVMAQLEPELWAEARRLGLPIVTEFFGSLMADELEPLHQQGLLGPDNKRLYTRGAMRRGAPLACAHVHV